MMHNGHFCVLSASSHGCAVVIEVQDFIFLVKYESKMGSEG